jgi:hypothetical protein
MNIRQGDCKVNNQQLAICSTHQLPPQPTLTRPLTIPPSFGPTRCSGCGVKINLSRGGYSHGPGGYECGAYTEKTFAKTVKNRAARN